MDAFVGTDTVNAPVGIIFGPDGDLYVSSVVEDTVFRYDGITGELIDNFIPAGTGGLDGAVSMSFGPDGNLYVTSRFDNSVRRFSSSTGAFIDQFVTSGSGGLDWPTGLLFAELPAPSGTPVPTATPVPWSAEICLDLREPSAEEPGDIVVQLTTSDASDLATYSQRLVFDSDHLDYADAFQNGLPSGFGLQPGTLLLDTSGADSGVLAFNAVGIEGYTGPQVLAEACFSILDESASSFISVSDHPASSAPYADGLTLPLSHHHCPPLEVTVPPRTTLCVRLLALDGDEELALLTGSEEGGADFRIVAETLEAEGLATFSQRLLYDPAVIQLVGEKSMLVINSSRKEEGIIDVSGSGIENMTGPLVLFDLDFEVLQGASAGTVTMMDNPESSAPYSDASGIPIPHDTCGATAYETLMDRDGDGIDDSVEGDVYPGPVAENRSNGFLFDSDGDGLGDGTEDLNRNGQWDSGIETRTRSADTDGDGWEDGVEVLLLGTDALDDEDPLEELEDLDGDGLPSAIDPDDDSPDADGDRYADAYEATILDMDAASDELTAPGLGDVNVDGFSDNGDSQLALNFFGQAPMPPEMEFEPNHADVDRNGIIDNGDAQYILGFFGTLHPLYPTR
jgi:hypothetical protein